MSFPHSVTVLNESFTKDSVDNTSWVGLGNEKSVTPFLTANPTDTAPNGEIAGNPNIQLDNNGEGVLRLTNAKTEQTGLVLFDQPLAVGEGLSVSFDFFSYGGTGADGIGLVFLDGVQAAPTQAGGLGGALGSAQRETPGQSTPGIKGSYLEVGFDEFGNFSNPTEGRNGGVGFIPDSVVVRGGEASQHKYLIGNKVPFSLDNPGSAATRSESLRKALVNLTKEGLLSVTVQADLNQDGDYDDANETVKAIDAYDVTAENGILPSTFKLGFSGATGAATNIHEIRNVVITTPGKLVPPVSNNAPDTNDVLIQTENTLVNVRGLNGTDSDGTVTAFIISTLPDAAQGTLFLGDPNQGGTIVTQGQEISAEQINQLFFQARPEINTGRTTFTYAAKDDDGAIDSTPATVDIDLRVLPVSNAAPETVDLSLQTKSSSITNLPALSATDADGTVTSYIIATLPDAKDGILFLGDPTNGGTRVTAGQELRPDQINQLFFQSQANFNGASFTYTARDDDQGLDPTPATVTINPHCGIGIRRIGNGRRNTFKGVNARDMLHGQGGRDRLNGRGCSDRLDGGRGNDTLYGGGGNDSVRGGQRNDRVFGNNGDDKVLGGHGNDNIGGGRGNDKARGGRGNDTVHGKHGDDELRGGHNDDILKGGTNRDRLRGNRGDDKLNGQKGADIVNGGLGHDTAFGGLGRDRIQGRRGDDVLNGGAGNDTLAGGAGNDVLVGSRRADVLIGGAGSNRFVYKALNDGGDRILDFDATQDAIDFSKIASKARFGSDTPFEDYVKLVQRGSNTQVQLDKDGDLPGNVFKTMATLVNVSPSALSTQNFVF